MNELTRQVADSNVIEGEFRDAGSPPPVRRVEARGYATLPPRPSPPPPPVPRRTLVQKKENNDISPYAPNWFLFMTLIATVMVVLWFFSMLHAEQAITGP